MPENLLHVVGAGALLLLLQAPALGQGNYPITLQTQLTPPYSAFISDYLDKAIISFTNHGQAPLDVYIRGRFENDRGQFVETAPYRYTNVPVHVPGLQTVVVQGSQLDNGYMDFNHLNTNLSDEDYNNFRRLGQLPEGFYTFCVYAYRRDAVGNYQAVSDPQAIGSCFMFPVTHVTPPVIITPTTGDTVNPGPLQQVNINWTVPVGIMPGAVLLYDLFLVRVPIGEDPQVSMGQAVDYNAGLFIKQAGLAIPNFQFNNLGGFNLEEGITYALMVRARDMNGHTAFVNNGRSAIETFVYGQPPPPPAATVSTTQGSCSCAVDVAALDQTNNTATLAPGSAFTMATLTVQVGSLAISGGTASGSGTVLIQQVPVQVTFSDVVVNNNGVAIAGTAKAKTSNAFGFLENNPLPSISTADYGTFMDRIAAHNLDAVQAGAGLMLPFGLHTFGAPDAVNVAIVGLDLTPAKATYNAIAAVQLADANHVLSLLAQDVCFSSTSIMCGDAFFLLAQDLELPGIHLKLHGHRSASEPGTFVRYSAGELNRFHIRAEYAFPTSLITRLDGGPVSALLDADAASWSDWTASVTLDPFCLPALPGVEFRVGQGAAYDHSTLNNPPSMPASFSEPLLAEKNAEVGTPLWTGFHLPAVTVSLPALVTSGTQGSGKLQFGATHLLVDGSGLTGHVGASNVISLNNGSLGGWYCSVDHVGITLLNSSFIGGGMNGKLILPFSNKDSQQARINYSCTLSADNSGGGLSYQLIAQQQDDIDFSAWWAHFNINNCSIEVSAGSSGVVASADLSGKLSIQGKVESYNVGLDLISIEHLVVSTASPHVTVQNVVAGFNSPQRFLANFPIQLIGVEPKLAGDQVGLQFDFKMTLSDVANEILPHASSKLTVGAKVLGGSRPLWQQSSFQLDQVCVNGDLAGVVHIKQGCIDFFRNDPTFGEGISGFLNASFAGIDGVEVECNARFGNKGFNYWYFDASVQLTPGIPVAPGININGIGGGAWYNMVRTANESLMAKDYFSNMRQYQLGAYRPQPGTLGFKAKLGLSSSDGYIYSGYGEIGLTFNTGGNLSLSALDGTFYAEILKSTEGLVRDPNAPVQGVISWHTGIADRVFQLTGRVDLKFPWGGTPAVSGSGWFDILADVGNNNYHVKFGEPASRLEVSVLGLATLKGYFMAGNRIDASIPDPDPSIVDVSRLSGYRRIQYNPASGGMVMGASFSMQQHVPFGIFFAEFGAGAGFDVSFARYTQGCKKNAPPPGVNGWYAIGQVYANIWGALGAEVDLPMIGHKRVTAAKIEVSALLQGGLPDPYWFDGFLNLHYYALGGILEGDVNFHISIGNKCVPEQQVFTMPLISELRPAEGSVKIPLNASAEVLFNYPVDKAFEIVLLNDDGQQESRLFKLILPTCQVTDLDRQKLYADYHNFQSYPIFLDERNTDLALDPEAAMEAQTRYRFDVTARAMERQGNSWVACTYNGKVVEESRSVSFKTGDCKLDEIIASPGSRLASFPFPGQRYFLQGDSPHGAVILDKEYGCAKEPNEDYDLLVRFTPLGAGEPAEAPIAFKGGRYLTFDIPTLPNANVVRLDVIKRRKLKANDSVHIMANAGVATGINQFASLGGGSSQASTSAMGYPLSAFAVQNATLVGNVPGTTGQAASSFPIGAAANTGIGPFGGQAPAVPGPGGQAIGGSSSATMYQGPANPNLRLTDRILDQVLYSYHFRTSRYNTLAAKAQSLHYRSTKGGFMENYLVEMGSTEGFDQFDAEGFVSTKYPNGQKEYFALPLVAFREARPDNKWITQYARPCIYDQYLPAGFSVQQVRYGQDGGTAISSSEMRHLGLDCDQFGCIPKRPIFINSFDPPLSEADIPRTPSVFLPTGTYLLRP